MKNFIWIFPLFLLLHGCAKYPENKLEGKWKGSELSEDGMPMSVDPGEIGFDFFNNGYYRFRSTLNYREAGTFSVKGDLLYTLDTMNEASTEKAVKILTLTADSLHLMMNADGKERIVKLARAK